MKIIDPHIHLFNLEQGDYYWLKADRPPFWSDKQKIAKNFTEQSLVLQNKLELAAFVHIEAGFDNQQPWREIAYLENTSKLPFRSIAFIDLLLPEKDFVKQLTKLLYYQSVVGCRYILAQQATEILTQQNTINNLKALANANLVFEAQLPLSDNNALNALMNLLTTIPKLKVIINHAGSPQLDNVSQHWLENLKCLGQLPSCAIKCSGWEMINRDYTTAEVTAVIQQCLSAFGDNRVMLASNFPLATFSKSYQQLWQDYQQVIKTLNLTTTQQTLLCFDNAKTWYRFNLL
jgi:predicted TIM-barrel fold metal-dependent hydrolase